MAGPNEQHVAASHFDALRGEGRLELGHRDVMVGRERLDAELGGHIGENASADDPVPQHGDVVRLGALRTDEGAVAAVVHAVLVEDVRQRVPLGRRLERHDDHVVGEAVALDAVGGLPARLHVGSGRHHRALRVEPVRHLELRRVRLEVDSQREGLAASDAARRLETLLRRDQVRGAELVVLTEAPPVGNVADELLDGRRVHGTGISRRRGATSAAKRRMLEIASSYGTPA